MASAHLLHSRKGTACTATNQLCEGKNREGRLGNPRLGLLLDGRKRFAKNIFIGSARSQPLAPPFLFASWHLSRAVNPGFASLTAPTSASGPAYGPVLSTHSSLQHHQVAIHGQHPSTSRLTAFIFSLASRRPSPVLAGSGTEALWYGSTHDDHSSREKFHEPRICRVFAAKRKAV